MGKCKPQKIFSKPQNFGERSEVKGLRSKVEGFKPSAIAISHQPSAISHRPYTLWTVSWGKGNSMPSLLKVAYTVLFMSKNTPQ